MEYKDRLTSHEPNGRARAMQELQKEPVDTVARVLGEALLDSNWPVCSELADGLAALGTGCSRDALLKALKARRHHIRSAAVKALSRLGDPSLKEPIAELADDPSYEVRQDVAEALGRLGQAG